MNISLRRISSSGTSFSLPAFDPTLNLGDVVLVGHTVAVVVWIQTGPSPIYNHIGVCFEGKFTVPKATGESWSLGEKLYFNSSSKKITITSSGNTPAGFALSDAGTNDTTGRCKVN